MARHSVSRILHACCLSALVASSAIFAFTCAAQSAWRPDKPVEIVVTAALGELPPPLIEQLKVGGRLVMPVGPAYTTQHLTVVDKIAPGKTTTRAVALVRFVPFTRSQIKSQ